MHTFNLFTGHNIMHIATRERLITLKLQKTTARGNHIKQISSSMDILVYSIHAYCAGA